MCRRKLKQIKSNQIAFNTENKFISCDYCKRGKWRELPSSTVANISHYSGWGRLDSGTLTSVCAIRVTLSTYKSSVGNSGHVFPLMGRCQCPQPLPMWTHSAALPHATTGSHRLARTGMRRGPPSAYPHLPSYIKHGTIGKFKSNTLCQWQFYFQFKPCTEPMLTITKQTTNE